MRTSLLTRCQKRLARLGLGSAAEEACVQNKFGSPVENSCLGVTLAVDNMSVMVR